MTDKAPVIWIVATGSEILQGHYSDRNGPWLSARLMEAGLRTARHMALPDDGNALRAGLGEAAAAADLVITTGGLGPTEDDLNRFAIADVWGRELYEDPEAIRGIAELLERRGRSLLPANRVQGQLPRGARLMPNPNGTAPGFFIPASDGQAVLLALPGPPRELQPMFAAFGLPLILECFGSAVGGALTNLTLRTAGLPEAAINERIRDLFGSDPAVEPALLFSLGTVDVRLTLNEPDPAAQTATAERWRRLIGERLGAENVYAEGAETLAACVGGLLRPRGQTVATAESCTGGLLAGSLTDVPGSSNWFMEGFVTYANDAKIARLGVPPGLIERHGAVSPEVAEAMAAGARRVTGCDWAIAVTGIAGPDGGTAEKPVGLVWFGLARPGGDTTALKDLVPGNRDEVRQRAVQRGLDLLRRGILGHSLRAQLPSLNPGGDLDQTAVP
jgi:nicotinamide-nucleotide amidase